MLELSLQTSMRTHTCGGLTAADVGKEVRLCGWVHSLRDHGGLLFIDLRDRWGITQLVVSPAVNKAVYDAALGLHPEYVLAASGTVKPRPAGMVNPNRATGEIEVGVSRFDVITQAETPPFEVLDDTVVSDELRMRYRYLDLRRRPMIDNMAVRHRVAMAMRNHLTRRGFVEIETPVLTKSTPEGARDFIIPSRLNPGRFYALPQSPQLMKQILMIAGIDRYFQIVKCFRDEDLRADRQPEHTQLDVEVSFVEESDVLEIIESLLVEVCKEAKGMTLAAPFQRISFAEAMEQYGTDKPDLRYEMRLADVSAIAQECDFRVFRGAVEAGGVVKGINAKGCAGYSRKEMDALTAYAADLGAKGLAWLKREGGGLAGPIAKFFTGGQLEAIASRMDAGAGDLLLFVADVPGVVRMALDRLRQRIAAAERLYDPGRFHCCWVTGFPLFKREDDGSIGAEHHPFCAPLPEDIDRLESDPLSVRARTFDLVINGMEIGSGSIRINDPALQKRVLAILGIGAEEADKKFGFLLEAYRYGGPPHGGIGFGLDRFVAILQRLDNIREVIAFPKTTSGICPLTGAPAAVEPAQLKELKIEARKNLS